MVKMGATSNFGLETFPCRLFLCQCFLQSTRLQRGVVIGYFFIAKMKIVPVAGQQSPVVRIVSMPVALVPAANL